MSTRTGNRSALLVVDVQVGVVADAWQRDAVVENVSAAVRRARDADVPVAWVQHQDEELQRDSPAWQWVPQLQPAPGESRIFKTYNSAFEDTPLLSWLEEHSVSRIVLAGAATNWCIRATAYGALERGFDVTLLSDAHTTCDIELGPGRIVAARSVIDDLNTTMRWLSYPGRVSSVAQAAEADFGPTAAPRAIARDDSAKR